MSIAASLWPALPLGALLGGVIGWHLRAASGRRELDRQEVCWQERMDAFYADLAEARERLAIANDRIESRERERAAARLEAEQSDARVRSLQAQIDTYVVDLEERNSQTLELAVALDETRRDLEQRDHRIADLERQLAADEALLGQ